MTRIDDRHERSPECGIDVAAYVLGGLDPDEATALQEHLATCAVCRDELAALQGVADALPLTVPQVAIPRGLKRRVMSEVRKETRASPVRQNLRRSSRLRLAAAFGSALVIAALIVGGVLLASGGSSPTRVVQASVTPPTASAVVRLRGGQAALVVHHMPQPPTGKIYEVWLKRGAAAPTPTDALFGVTSSGSASVVVPGNLHGVSVVLVTPERRGGSLAPTHAPVIVAQL